MDENKKNPAEELPEGFRPTVPEPEIHRRPVYGFRKDYPETEKETSTHTVPLQQLDRRKKIRNRIIAAVAALILFCIAYVLTYTGLIISNQPIV